MIKQNSFFTRRSFSNGLKTSSITSLIDDYTMESLKLIRNLERKAPSLIRKYGVKECRSCGCIKILCFPFFSQMSDICTDCEDKIQPQQMSPHSMVLQ